jgi:hypothetical protein
MYCIIQVYLLFTLFFQYSNPFGIFLRPFRRYGLRIFSSIELPYAVPFAMFDKNNTGNDETRNDTSICDMVTMYNLYRIQYYSNIQSILMSPYVIPYYKLDTILRDDLLGRDVNFIGAIQIGRGGLFDDWNFDI